jgi:hypothetical protein
MARYWKTNSITTLLFFLIPNVFPSCFHKVSIKSPKGSTSSKVVPQHVPNNTWIISHTMVCPKFKPHVYKVKRWAIGSTFVSILWIVVQRCACNGRVPNVWNFFGDGPNQDGSFKTKKHDHTHKLINMNHTMSIWGSFVQLVGLSFKFFITI